MMVYNRENIFQEGKKFQKKNQDVIKKLKNWSPGKIDNSFHQLHEQAFEKINCLECANCCKTTSPVFSQHDIERIAKAMKIKPGQFIEKYLRKDEENDFVLKNSPCPFLEEDNRCNIYNNRPTACKTYPHTNRKKMIQLLDLTYRNSFICPAVQNILHAMEKLTQG